MNKVDCDMKTPCKIIAWLATFCLCGSAFSTASSEEKRMCVGDLQTTVRSGPYDFLIVSRVESKPDLNIAILCIQNNTDGALFFSWPVAGATGWIPPGDSLERPYLKNTPLTVAVGCFFYGNLSVRGEAAFFTDYQTILQADREKQGGCAKPALLTQ